jgi:amino acid adenylation domain-containing protein
MKDDPGSVEPETIWTLIERRAATHPERAAILDDLTGVTEIDYWRLVRRAEAIATELAARGVEPGSLVAVCMDRTWELVAALVGVLRAGCAYVPLDPTYPRQRLDDVLEHSRAVAAVVDDDARAELCVAASEIVRLDDVGEFSAAAADAIPAPRPDHLAYVLYTSGTTGRPKGVAVEHAQVVAFSRSMGALLGDEELAGVSASASVSFDASVLELLGTLSLGGTVVLAGNLLELPELPAADRIRTLVMVPTALQTLLATGAIPRGVRSLVLGGEVLPRSLADQLHALEPRPRVVNVYGPTETTVYVTATDVAPGTGPIPIGRPVPGTRGYALDESLEPVPIGEPGELYLAGDQLARGYLHDEERTRERFVEVTPSRAIPETRLYRTGDLCRFRQDGEIEFLGRADQQVKLRGFRIELGEIEAALAAIEGVEAAAAAVVDGPGGRKMLAGYVVSTGGAVSSDAARARLAERLPEYLVPQTVISLDELPRLPNGKLDRSKLPGPSSLEPKEALDQAPKESPGRDPLPLVRAEIASLLGLSDPELVPLDRSVVDLGLDSLTSAELASRLGAVFGRKLPVSVILEHSTAAALAGVLRDSAQDQPAGRSPAASEMSETSEMAGEAPDTLGHLQTQMQSSYPLFMAAGARCWSVDDKARLVRELKRLVSGSGRDPHTKVIRTGSAHRGIVADVLTREERETIIWTTNLYLGLNRDPGVIEEARQVLEQFGTGMGTSALAGGISDLHQQLEREFSGLVGKSSACLFTTGYTANLGVIAGLLSHDDVVVIDQLCHASIVDGARLSGVEMRTFRHNSASDLESVLRAEASPHKTILVVFESVYSMGEGTAPIEDLVRVAKKYGALVLVDEAHSFGFYGPRGAGFCAERGVTDQVDFVMTTLSKALGSLGGIVAASEEHIALLKSSSRSFIFQASTTPTAVAAALASLRRFSQDDTLRDRLWERTAYMRQRFTEAGFDLGTGDGPVITPHFAGKDRLFRIVAGLFQRGVLTSAVTYPVVEAGRGRLRFICSASHTEKDIDKTLEALIEAEREANEAIAAIEAARNATTDRRPAPTRRAPVEAWADAFANDLERQVAHAPLPTPDLTVSVELPDDGEPITFGSRRGKVTRDGLGASGVPFCSLRPATDRAADALCSGNVAELLDCVLDGTCVLAGQAEPFVWLVGRLVESRNDRPT